MKVSEFLKRYIADARKEQDGWSADDFGKQVNEGLHVTGVVVSPCDGQGKQTAIVTGDGVELIPAITIRRGVRVAIAFTSEHGDSFIREFHFHKGDTYMKDVPCPGDLPIEKTTPLDIWRD